MADLLQNKVFVFAQNPTPSESEIYFLDIVAENANLGKIHGHEIVSYNDNYDVYKIQSNLGPKIVKLSLDPEFNFENDPQPLNGPKTFSIVKADIGVQVVAKIEDFITAPSLAEIGESNINSGWPLVVKAIINNSKEAHNRTLKDHLKALFKQTSLDENKNLDILVKTNSSNYQLIKKGAEELKKEVEQLYKPWHSVDTLINGNISSDNLFLDRNDAYISSWGKSYSAHVFLELAALKMNIDMPQLTEYDMFNELKRQSSSENTWEDYIQCKTFVASYKFLECVFSFIKETFLFEGKRRDELLKLSSYFCRNLGLFNNLAGFRKNQEELLKLFSSPVV